MEKYGPVLGAPSPAPARRRLTGLIILSLIILLASAGFWYYFFGQKPRIVLTVPFPKTQEEERSGLWPVGESEVLLLGNGEVKLVNVSNRTVKWTAKIPAAPVVDRAWRDTVNARFVRLQQWADDLTIKRSNLKTPKETKDFNEEADKYRSELANVRAELARNSAQVVPPSAPATPAKPASTPAKVAKMGTEAKSASTSAAAAAPKLKPVSTPEMQLLEQRIKRRTDKMKQIQRSIVTKKTAAKTEIQLSVVHDEEARLRALTNEQKLEQESLARLQGNGTAKPEEPMAEGEKAPDESESSFFSEQSAPYGGTVGNAVWIIDGEHMVSFDRASGTIKSDVALAGPALRAWSHSGEICVVASAGADARQITRITAASGPVSLYVPAGKVESSFDPMEESGIKPNAQTLRTEFEGPLLRADLKLVEKNVVARDAIKKDSDKVLTQTIDQSVAHSTDELEAVAKLIANDAQRLSGITKEWVDDSSYELTLRRPFNPSAPEWKGTLRGRVHFFSTNTYDLVAAGSKLLAFDHANQKLWESGIGSPVGRRKDENGNPAQTCVEFQGRIYFADGAFLNAFEATTGRVLWRLPSIGIQKLQLDSDGNIYVQTLNLGTESLTHVLDESFQAINPLTIKVNPADGKIAWQVEKYQDLWVSGSDIYVLRETRNPADMENQVFDPSKVPEARVKIYKLSRRNGSPTWEWYQPRRPRVVHADRKHVGLLFGNELQLLHSIAL